jgi:hypothetical protein
MDTSNVSVFTNTRILLKLVYCIKIYISAFTQLKTMEDVRIILTVCLRETGC